jgi:hypothetical protein
MVIAFAKSFSSNSLSLLRGERVSVGVKNKFLALNISYLSGANRGRLNEIR